MFCHARTRINMRRRLKATASSSAPQATAATALKNAWKRREMRERRRTALVKAWRAGATGHRPRRLALLQPLAEPLVEEAAARAAAGRRPPGRSAVAERPAAGHAGSVPSGGVSGRSSTWRSQSSACAGFEACRCAVGARPTRAGRSPTESCRTLWRARPGRAPALVGDPRPARRSGRRASRPAPRAAPPFERSPWSPNKLALASTQLAIALVLCITHRDQSQGGLRELLRTVSSPRPCTTKTRTLFAPVR